MLRFCEKIKEFLLLLIMPIFFVSLAFVAEVVCKRFDGVRKLLGCDVLSIIIAAITLFVAVLTYRAAIRIAFVQQWNTLVAEYRSHAFGAALKAVSDFFVNECNGKIHEVSYAYANHKEKKKKVDKTLNFQRRMLAQFYWQFDVLVDSCFCARGWVKKYFNKNEMNLMAIVYNMNLAEDKNYSSLWLEDSGKEFNSGYSQNDSIKHLYNYFAKVFEKDKRGVQELECGKKDLVFDNFLQFFFLNRRFNMAKIKYTFKDLCKDVKQNLPSCLHSTGEGEDFIWIATAGYDIGVYPIHYEIRLEKNKVYAEVHFESKGVITYVETDGSHRTLQERFVTYFDNAQKRNFVKVNPGASGKNGYRWYRLKKSGVSLVDKNCTKKVLQNIQRVTRLTQNYLLGLMGKVFV